MNDRTMIAAMAMQGMLTALGGSGNDKDIAERAVSKADALLKALAESEAERPQLTTSDDQRLVTGVDLELLSPRPSPEWWGAVPDDATAQATGVHDEVGDWREYVAPDGKKAIGRIANGGMSRFPVFDAFTWEKTPQGAEFWLRIYYDDATEADKSRAQDFARRVLEAMEASDD